MKLIRLTQNQSGLEAMIDKNRYRLKEFQRNLGLLIDAHLNFQYYSGATIQKQIIQEKTVTDAVSVIPIWS